MKRNERTAISPQVSPSDTVTIFDTTLRDGEQSPGFSMNTREKLVMARQLERLNVDVIEAGFPIASEGDFEAVRAVAGEIRGRTIAGLARAGSSDISRAAQALEKADRPRIHTFIATSPIHMEKKLKLTPEQVLEKAVKAVELARTYVDDVEFSAEDATRSDWDFLVQIYSAVAEAGAKTLNVPDTVGYITPDEYGKLISHLRQHVTGAKGVVFSVHCHNDLGLSVANSLAAVAAGARQVECTINGIGERAGNAALEEVVMSIATRRDHYRVSTGVDTRQISPSSRMLRHITGIQVQPNKAIVGDNAFAHEAGIHQDGVLKDRLTYEIMTPESVGIGFNALVLGKHSGRHAFQSRLTAMGYGLSGGQLDQAFKTFKALADRKKTVYDEDLESIVLEGVFQMPRKYALLNVNVVSGTDTEPTATVIIDMAGKVLKQAGHGDGPVDAVYKTIAAMTGDASTLQNYRVQALTPETDAMGEVAVSLTDGDLRAVGRGAHTDIVVASAQAYLDALNRMEYKRNSGGHAADCREG